MKTIMLDEVRVGWLMTKLDILELVKMVQDGATFEELEQKVQSPKMYVELKE